LLQGLSGRHPENPTILRELGMVQLSLGQPAEAERVLRRSLRHDPAVVVEEGADMRARPEARGHAVETARAALALGKAQAGQGRQDEAVPAYRLAADLGRDDPEILGEAGAGLVRARRTAEALPLLERALRLAPSSSQSADLRRLFDDLQSRVQGGADALLRRAQRSESERNYREAAVAYEEALATDPTRIQAYIRLAWIRGYQGRYPAANEMLDRALAVVENTGGPGADDARRDIERERRALAEAQARDEAEERRMLGETTAPDGH
jgi:tetratricopeptide (TPR) repeat protein